MHPRGWETNLGIMAKKSVTDETTLQHLLLDWFGREQRDLPWRRTQDPYAIWVSEIMLQQTRVAAVLEPYRAFLECFPTVQALAAAEEAAVLAAWSGLGYYRRARMLHRAAQQICSSGNGQIPQSHAALLELPGIGRYTAAAIASIAYGEPVAAVDGNVERVLLRLRGWGSEDPVLHAQHLRRVHVEASRLLQPASPGDWNQAMMELGATVCLPRSPRCEACPWMAACATRGEHDAVRRVPMRTETCCYRWQTRLSAGVQQLLLIQRSQAQTVMPGMWELPQAPYMPDKPGGKQDKPILQLRHAIMQVNYRITIVSGDAPAPEGGRWVTAEEAATMALTGLARKVMRRLGWLPTGSRGPMAR